MARVTVEDCLKNVKNRFELVIVAAKRARQLMRGKESRVDWDNDKATVVALREIAAGYTNLDENPDRDERVIEMHVINNEASQIDHIKVDIADKTTDKAVDEDNA